MGLAFRAPRIFSLDEKLTHHDDEYCDTVRLLPSSEKNVKPA